MNQKVNQNKAEWQEMTKIKKPRLTFSLVNHDHNKLLLFTDRHVR